MSTPAQTPADVVEVAKRLAERVAELEATDAVLPLHELSARVRELEAKLEQREAELHATDLARLGALAATEELESELEVGEILNDAEAEALSDAEIELLRLLGAAEGVGEHFLVMPSSDAQILFYLSRLGAETLEESSGPREIAFEVLRSFGDALGIVEVRS